MKFYIIQKSAELAAGQSSNQLLWARSSTLVKLHLKPVISKLALQKVA